METNITQHNTMTRNTRGGKTKHQKRTVTEQKTETPLKKPGEEYAQVTKMLGNGRLEAKCFDGKKRLCHIRGTMRKRIWVSSGDIILVDLREFQDDKGDVTHKYSDS